MLYLSADFNWGGLILLIGLWFFAVVLALAVIDFLFPRMRRGSGGIPLSRSKQTAPPLRPIARPPTTNVAPLTIASTTNLSHWHANLRLVGVMLGIWAAVILVPTTIAPLLNRVQILTGFPLGYYMGAQGALIVFLGLVTTYAWYAARLDRSYDGGASTAIPPRHEKIWQIALVYAAFTTGFIILIWLLGILETQEFFPTASLGWLFLATTLSIYAIIGILSRTRNLDDYFVAGRRVPAFFNGMAISADWMSAASFISMAGTLWLLGYEGLAYIMGWTGGYVLLAVLLAPYLRKFGQFTLPDFIAARYGGNRVRLVSAIICIIISFTYVTAQVTGIGIIMSRFLGVQYLPGVFIGLGAVLFCSYLGGMRATTWTQVAQCIVILLAYLTPVTILSFRSTGVPLPQIMYGEALQNIEQLETAQGIANAYITPFNDWTPWNFGALMLCLMFGTAGMPHILVRFYTVPSVAAARHSVSWALFFICLLYFTAPAYAAFSRWEVLQNVVDQPMTEVPEWAVNWSETGLLTMEDINGDGILSFNELDIYPDLVVLATPEIAGLPHMVGALVAAGGLAAALSTADGLLMVIASALSHDIYTRVLGPRTPAQRRLLLGRAMVLLAAVAAAITAIGRLGIIVQLVAWAFSIAAATLFPVLVLGIFWKRGNGAGAIAGMLAGLVVTLTYMLINLRNPAFNVLGITDVAAGIFGLPVNVLVMIVVSKLTPPPSAATQALVDSLRQP